MVSTRPEIEAAENEYESFRVHGGLEPEQLTHVMLDEVDLADAFDAQALSGVIIGGSPYNASTPFDAKTRTQVRVEEEVGELLATALKDGVPVLATGFGLEVLANHLGTATSTDFGEDLGAADLFVTEEGRRDPVLAGLPETFTVFVGHHEGAVAVPENSVLLASSPDCPVQMIRVGERLYGTQFNPELDADHVTQRISAYLDAGYGDPGQLELVLSEARLSGGNVAGRIVRNFVERFAQD